MQNFSYHQIKKLYEFTKKHYVVHVEVQRFIVEQLAEKINTIKNEKPELNFDEALDLAFKSYGIFGFSEIEEKLVNRLHKTYTWFFVRYYIKQFLNPKNLLLILSYILLAVVFYYAGLKDFFTISTIVLLYACLIYQLIVMKKRNKIKRKSQKASLIEEALQNTFQIMLPILFIPQFYLHFYATFQPYSYILIHLFVIVFISYLYIVNFNINRKKIKQTLTLLTKQKLQFK
ncbi:hypothetical protein [Psychroflexus halocasei]|uniref:Uncharacterized protein n=1 Tax=Psychroflexus halocasei TaxID=908615 RepID=A0A1H4CAG1_9FLAO|nr:hypothetical protein [Psychroflexus halocasei]SEA57279.1 hypothetical protein SAMN05421540_107115 [Psychroflexus halocasei]